MFNVGVSLQSDAKLATSNFQLQIDLPVGHYKLSVELDNESANDIGITMQVYLVGGAVRDALLGLEVTDKDYVVVGSTPQEMLDKGFTQVGKDFPVFLHPHSKDEYALARTERKAGKGYTGFTCYAAPDVNLEEDLKRRDLTINAIAQADDGTYVDPFGGLQDLKARILRHVSPAFCEDPLRVLRLARFAARFAPQGFEIAPETWLLAQQMVAHQELSELIGERVWQEVSRALMGPAPDKFAGVLGDLQAWPQLLHCDATIMGHWPLLSQLTMVGGKAKYSLATRFALLTRALFGDHQGHLSAVIQALRVPNECAEVSQLVCRLNCLIITAPTEAEPYMALLRAADPLRRAQRWEQAMDALTHCVEVARGPNADNRLDGNTLANLFIPTYDDLATLEAIRQAYCNVDAATFIQHGLSGAQIGQALQQARTESIQKLLAT